MNMYYHSYSEWGFPYFKGTLIHHLPEMDSISNINSFSHPLVVTFLYIYIIQAISA